jgi:hypothetical protein
MSYNNILQNIKPKNILGQGSEGIIILSNNKKYTVKIYDKNINKLQTYINIINYIQQSKKLPKTIYKSYLITTCKNSLNRYIKNNLPIHFSYTDDNNLKILSKRYNMQNKLFEIMKTYNLTLKILLKNIKSIDIELKNNILSSLYKQGILTLLWLYINKGIVHNDITLDNFFILKTTSKNFKINIYKDTYKVKLYGYYLIIADFGYAKSIEIDNKYNNIPLNNILYQFNPLHDIKRFINIFPNKIKKNNINTLDDELNRSYNIMIEAYIKNDLLFKKYKNIYKHILYNFIKKYIINTF